MSIESTWSKCCDCHHEQYMFQRQDGQETRCDWCGGKLELLAPEKSKWVKYLIV